MASLRHASFDGLTPTEAASEWLVRLDQGPLTPQEQQAFDSWRATPAHAAAIARAENVWNLFEGENDPHLRALRESALAAGPEPRRGWWLGLGAGIAASLAAAFFFGAHVVDIERRTALGAPTQSIAQNSATPDQNGDFATGRGERRTIKLGDGSVVTLNTGSAIRVSFSQQQRMIHLLRGQALFEVAKNRAVPFVVQAGDRQVTALGTVFEVRLDVNRLKVTLVEGKVVVDGVADRPRNGVAAIVPTVLSPGEELLSMAGAPFQLAKVDVEQELRWREGFVEFEDEPLANAVREMNRYSDSQLVIADPKLASLRVSGVFRTGNTARFASIVGELLPVTARTTDGQIELVSARPK